MNKICCPDLRQPKKIIKKWLELQREKQNRKDSMRWEKKINFVFLLARWWKKLARVLLCILRKHVLIFSFNERSDFFVFSHLFWVSLEIALSFFFSIEQQKRDFTSEIWASNDENNKKLKSWIVGKSASRKNYWVNFVSLHCEK